MKKKVLVDKFNNKFIIDENNTLLSVEGESDEVELPNDLEKIGKRAFSNRGFKKMYFDKNLKVFNRGAFIYSYTIENLYYPGSVEDFNKIYFEPGCAKTPVLDHVKKLFVLDNKGKYYQAIFNKTTMAEARGLNKELIDACLTRNAAVLKATCKKSLKNDGVKVFVRYYENQLKVIAETRFFDLDDELKQYLLDKEVSLLMDDIIINYAITKETMVKMVRPNGKMKFVKSHYGDAIIEGNNLVDFKVDLSEFNDWEIRSTGPNVAINIGKDITCIANNSFNSIARALINYDGDIKDWLKISFSDDIKAKIALVRCNNGTIEYVNVNHANRATSGLYYGYAHMGNNYRYSLQFAIGKKNIWEFIKLAHLSIIAWGNFCGVPYDSQGDDSYDEDEKEYCILDFHNFKMINCCDVESG